MKCAYCFGTVVVDQCPECWSCEAVHHRDCWVENLGCAQFGCAGNASLEANS
jgi:hypothetical protein